MNNFIDKMKIRNSKGKNGKIHALLNGEDKKFDTIGELVDNMWALANSFQHNDWWSDMAEKISDKQKSDNRSPDVIWKEVVTEAINETIWAKKEKIAEINKYSNSSAFESKLVPCRFSPNGCLFNDEDKKLLDGLVYCRENEMIYGKTPNGGLKMLGDPKSFGDKRTPSYDELYDYVEDRLSRANGLTEGGYDIWIDFYKTANNLTSEYVRAKSEMFTAMQNGMLPDNSYFYCMGEKTTFGSVLKCVSNVWPGDAEDDLLSYYVKIGLNYLYPTIIFNRNMINLFYETKNDEFKRIAIKPIENKKQFAGEIANELFQYRKEALRHVEKMDKAPSVIEDRINVPAKYHIVQNWQDRLPEGQFNRSESKILKAFLEPFKKEERIFMMAWAYTIFHPSTEETLSLCIMTGGQTFKTSYFSKCIRKILSYMYGETESKLVCTLMKSKWVKNDQLKEPKGGAGISNAAFIFNDECEEESIDQFKEYSGSANEDGHQYTYKIVYQQPITLRIKSKWLFCTNKPFTINDSDGVFNRRLAIIDRKDLSMFKPVYGKDEFDKMRDRELLSFYNAAKEAYNNIVESYGSLQCAADNIECIHGNLTKAHDEEGKEVCYLEIYDKVANVANTNTNEEISRREVDKEGRECYWVLRSALQEYIDQTLQNSGINPIGMRKWIESTDKTIGNNQLKTTKIMKCGGTNQLKNVARLYPIKKEVIERLEKESEC